MKRLRIVVEIRDTRNSVYLEELRGPWQDIPEKQTPQSALRFALAAAIEEIPPKLKDQPSRD